MSRYQVFTGFPHNVIEGASSIEECIVLLEQWFAKWKEGDLQYDEVRVLDSVNDRHVFWAVVRPEAGEVATVYNDLHKAFQAPVIERGISSHQEDGRITLTTEQHKHVKEVKLTYTKAKSQYQAILDSEGTFDSPLLELPRKDLAYVLVTEDYDVAEPPYEEGDWIIYKDNSIWKIETLDKEEGMFTTDMGRSGEVSDIKRYAETEEVEEHLDKRMWTRLRRKPGSYERGDVVLFENQPWFVEQEWEDDRDEEDVHRLYLWAGNDREAGRIEVKNTDVAMITPVDKRRDIRVNIEHMTRVEPDGKREGE